MFGISVLTKVERVRLDPEAGAQLGTPVPIRQVP